MFSVLFLFLISLEVNFLFVLFHIPHFWGSLCRFLEASTPLLHHFSLFFPSFHTFPVFSEFRFPFLSVLFQIHPTSIFFCRRLSFPSVPFLRLFSYSSTSASTFFCASYSSTFSLKIHCRRKWNSCCLKISVRQLL